MSRFEPYNPKQEAYELSRREWLKDHPLVTREEIEHGKAEAPLMTPEEIIAAGTKLIIESKS